MKKIILFLCFMPLSMIGQKYDGAINIYGWKFHIKYVEISPNEEKIFDFDEAYLQNIEFRGKGSYTLNGNETYFTNAFPQIPDCTIDLNGGIKEVTEYNTGYWDSYARKIKRIKSKGLYMYVKLLIPYPKA